MKIDSRPAAPLALAATLLLGLAGCGSPARNGAAGETELTVLLDWYPNAVHSFLYEAEEQGYFKEAGLKVKLQTPVDTNDALKLVASGQADLALSYQMQVAISRAEDIPVVSVGAIVRHPLNQLMTLASSGVRQPQDLAGRTIGYPSIPLDEEMVKTMVQADGGDPSAVHFVDVGWDLIPAMTTNKVDGIIGGYINHEKLLLEKEGEKLTAFDPAKYGVPDYYELVMTASEAGLERKGEAIAKFMAAAARGQQYVQEHPDEAIRLLLDRQDKQFPLDPDVERQSLAVLLPLMDAGPEPFGTQSADSWTAAIGWLTEHGLLAKDVTAAEAYRNLDAMG